jgi:nicotinamidase-related amidase
MRLPADSTLVILDAPDALLPEETVANVEALLAAWREQSLPIVHVRRDVDATAPPQGAWTATPPAAAAESVVTRAAASAFEGSDLEALLDALGATTLVVCGALGHDALGATVRDGLDRGFRIFVVAGACWPAEETNAWSLAALADGEARIVSVVSTLAAAATAMSRRRRDEAR